MVLKRKILGISVSLIALVQVVAAHEGPGPGYGMMGDCLQEGWCDGAAHMMGYGWLGTGSFGLLLGLAVWALAIYGAYRLLRDGSGED